MAFKDRASTSNGGFVGWVIHAILRFLQFVFAITVAGLYGTDIDRARKKGGGGDSRWVYAEVVAGLSALTCIVYMVPVLKSFYLFAWDAVLFILWVAVFGVFGKLYMHVDPMGDSSLRRMKNAVWIDLINMLLWFVSAAYGAALFLKFRKTRSTYTGRATV